jgi:hypothetical protein
LKIPNRGVDLGESDLHFFSLATGLEEAERFFGLQEDEPCESLKGTGW